MYTPDEPFILYVADRAAPLHPGERPLGPVGCPLATLNEPALLLRPRTKLAWHQALQAAATQHNPPRCLLLGMPDNPINLTPAALNAWANEARYRLPPATTCGLYIPEARYPCGHHPLCQKNCARQALAAQTFIQESATRESDLFSGLEQQFPTLKKHKLEILLAYARRPDPGNPSRPITLTALGKEFNTDRKTIRRALDECKALNPNTFTAIERFRNQRAQQCNAYHVE